MNNNLMNAVLVTLVLTLSPFEASFAGDFDDSEIRKFVFPDWFNENPFFDLAEIVKQAKSDQKHGVMVLFATQGCAYCFEFMRRSLGHPGIAATVRKNFVSVGLEIFDDTEMIDPRGVPVPVKQFARAQGASFAPSLLFFDVNGERILQVVGYQSPERFTAVLDYITGKHYRTGSLAHYFSRRPNKAAMHSSNTGRRADPLFSKPPYALDRSISPAQQPLLVIFEEPGCPECEDFHDSVLALKEVRDILTQFEIVRLDAADEKTPVLGPDGRRLTPASWFKQAALTHAPALLFFDDKGDEVLRIDALVLRQRMMNSMLFVLERAYEKGWGYQRFARSKAIEKHRKNLARNQ